MIGNPYSIICWSCPGLVDCKAGIKPNNRVKENLKAELVDSSAVMSYENATVELSRYNRELKVSKQTVRNYVKEFEAKEEPVPEEKRQIAVLYIEADEDHFKLRGKKRSPWLSWPVSMKE